MNELGKNAESFVDHISVGILSIGMELEDFVFQVTKNNEDQRVGILMSQLPFHKMDEDNMLESSHAIICYEDGIEWFSKTKNSAAMSMPINEKQPASMLAMQFLGAIATNNPIVPPVCKECEESNHG